VQNDERIRDWTCESMNKIMKESKRRWEREKERERDRNIKNNSVLKLESSYYEMIVREQRFEKTIEQDGKRTRKQ